MELKNGFYCLRLINPNCVNFLNISFCLSLFKFFNTFFEPKKKNAQTLSPHVQNKKEINNITRFMCTIF